MGNGRRPVKVFVSYAHDDASTWLPLIRKPLDFLQNEASLTYWHDGQIMPSDRWDPAIKNELEEAELVIALLSWQFMASRYCTQDELKRTLVRAAKDEARVLGILVEPCAWAWLGISDYQLAPQDNHGRILDLSSFADGPDRNNALTQIAFAVKKVVDTIAARPTPHGAGPNQANDISIAVTPPRRIIGRDGQRDQIIAHLAAHRSPRIAVFGAAGIGKTTLSQAAASAPSIKALFDACAFVDLQAVTSASAMEEEIAASLGIKNAGDATTAIDQYFGMHRSLIVLDNLETPLDSDESQALATLERLAAIPNAGIIASIRRSAAPAQIAWTWREDVHVLDRQSARALFLDIAGPAMADDPAVDELLDELDGLPLAIELVAEQAGLAGSAAITLERWRASPSAMLNIGDNKQRSLKLSIDLTLNSGRLTPLARRLFALAGRFPDGLPRDYLGDLTGEPTHNAEFQLLASRLVTLDGERLRMLAPVREQALAIECDPSDAARYRDFMFTLVESIEYA